MLIPVKKSNYERVKLSEVTITKNDTSVSLKLRWDGSDTDIGCSPPLMISMLTSLENPLA